VEEFGEADLDPGSSDETIRRQAEMLLAVDDGLGRIDGRQKLRLHRVLHL
jgi:hypothetical protein